MHRAGNVLFRVVFTKMLQLWCVPNSSLSRLPLDRTHLGEKISAYMLDPTTGKILMNVF